MKRVVLVPRCSGGLRVSASAGRSTFVTAAPALLALCLVGCVGNRQYTYSPSKCAENPMVCEPQRLRGAEDHDPPVIGGERKRYRQSVRCFPYPGCAGREDRKAGDYTLALVEFDDQGELWEPAQLDAVRQRLKEREESSIVIVFIHGWKNNASRYSEKSKNLGSFKAALERLSKADSGKREVIGVFFAWRGNTLHTVPSLWVGQQLTIFGRRAIAGKVASVSASHSLHRVVNWAKDETHNSCGGLRQCNAFAVAVGHSLGALILENILLRSLTVQTTDPTKIFPADLAVLVNSANPALLARRFLTGFERGPVATGGLECDELSQQRCSAAGCACYKIPLVVSMTSRWDTATRFLLPVEGWLTGLFKNFRPYDPPAPHTQAFYSRHAPGHINDGEFLTHEVVYLPPEVGDDPQAQGANVVPRDSASKVQKAMQSDSADAANCFFPDVSNSSSWDCDPRELDRYACFDKITYPGCEPGSHYRIQRIRGVYAGSSQEAPNTREARNNSPYWVMSLPRGLIRGHGDIFGSELSSLIAALVNLPGMAPDWEPQQKESFPD